ncbi:MAG: sialidase family protein [Bacillota bacterium]
MKSSNFRFQLAVLGLLPLALTACGGGSSSSSAPTVLVPPSSTLVRVSEASPYSAGCGGALGGSVSYEDAEVEPYLAINPTNPSNIIGVWQQDRWSDGGAHGLVAGYSMDGGKTWKETPLLFSRCAGGNSGNGGNYARASDPWVSFSPDGVAYTISISFDGVSLEPGSDGSVLVARSTDGGATWSDPVTLIFSGSGEFNDKESVTADPNNSNYVYAVWDQLTDTGLGATHFARTIDGGKTWEAEKVIYDPGVDNQTIGNEIVGESDGTILDLFEEIDNTASSAASGRIRVIRSTDHGATWSAPITVADNFAVGTVDPDTGEVVRSGAGLPQMAAGPGQTLVVAWQDGRFTGGAVDGIALSRSSDGGLHWSSPVQINSHTGVDAFTPSVAVLADGTIGVSYFDFRDNTPDPNTLPAEYWFTSSTDGVHWREQHVTGPFDMDLAPRAEGLFVGDYESIGVIGSAFVPFFVQTNDDGTADRTDSYFRPAAPNPLVLTRKVSNIALPGGNLQPGDAFRHKVHENLMRLMHNEIPNWDAIRASRMTPGNPP